MGVGFRNIRFEQHNDLSSSSHQFYNGPTQNEGNVYSSEIYKPQPSNTWQDQCINYPNNFEFEMAARCCPNTFYDDTHRNIIKSINGVGFEIECFQILMNISQIVDHVIRHSFTNNKNLYWHSAKYRPYPINDQAETIGCGWNRFEDQPAHQHIGTVERAMYPTPEGCVSKGFQGIYEQRCLIRWIVGDKDINTLKNSKWNFPNEQRTNNYDLLQNELLPRKIQQPQSSLPKLDCVHVQKYGNHAFCPNGYQVVGGGFSLVNDLASITNQNNVWMSWPLLAKNETNPTNYNDMNGEFPWNAEVSHITSSNKCYRKDIQNVTESGGWSAAYGINPNNNVKTHVACCKVMNNELSDDIYYDINDRIIDPMTLTMNPSTGISYTPSISDSKISHYSSWGAAFEVKTPLSPLQFRDHQASSTPDMCLNWNGIWKRDDIYYCIKSERHEIPNSSPAIIICKLTEISKNIEFYSSLNAPSQSIYYPFTVSLDKDYNTILNPNIQVIGSLSMSQNEISWQQDGVEIFVWTRDNVYPLSPTFTNSQKYNFKSNLINNEMILLLSYFKWFRFGEQPPYQSKLFTSCPDDYLVAKKWFLNTPNFVGINNTVMDIITAETGKSIFKGDNGIIHDINGINTISNMEFTDIPVLINWFTSGNLYIVLKYEFKQDLIVGTRQYPGLIDAVSNPCWDIKKSRCARDEGVSSPIKLSVDALPKSCSLGFTTIIDRNDGDCDGNQYQSYFPLGFKDNQLDWTQLKTNSILDTLIDENRLCPTYTLLYDIPNHLLSPPNTLQSTQCGVQSSRRLTAPHCVFSLHWKPPSTSAPIAAPVPVTAPVPAMVPSYFANEYQHRWNVKMVLNSKGCIGIKEPDKLFSLLGKSSLYLDPDCGIKHETSAYVSPYFTVKFVDDPGQPGIVHIEWKSWSTQKRYYLCYTASNTNYDVLGPDSVKLFSADTKPTSSQCEFYIDSNFQLIAKQAQSEYTYCLWYDSADDIILIKCGYLLDKLVKEVSFIGGDTLSMDNQYAQFNCFFPSVSNQQLCSIDEETKRASNNPNGFGTMNQWGIMSSVGDKRKFSDGVYRKALIRIDPYNDNDIISTAQLNGIENTFDLVSTSCSIIGYSGKLVEFNGVDYRLKYNKAYDLCGHGVKYKCFIGMKCNKNSNSGKISWISNNVPLSTTELSNIENKFSDSLLKACTDDKISKSDKTYYYFIDGADGKIRRTTFDYNLKDIRMGICEIGESQLICNKAQFVYAQRYDLSIDSALHHYYIHGHKHDNIWNGHLCHPKQSNINPQNAESIPYMKIYVDDTIPTSEIGDFCQKKCDNDPFCSDSIGGRECLFNTTFDPKSDYDINFDNNNHQILSGIPIIESALIGWNCKSSLFENNMLHKVGTSNMTAVQSQTDKFSVIHYSSDYLFRKWIGLKFMDVGFIWITYINLNTLQQRMMTRNECIYLCYQHRSCVFAVYSDEHCILYGAKLEYPDYNKYIDYEKCYFEHLFSCIYVAEYIQFNPSKGYYFMNKKPIQGMTTWNEYRPPPTSSPLSQLKEYNDTRKVYYRYSTDSELCQTQCSQLQTCNIYAHHGTIFDGICFMFVSDTNDIPSGAWNEVDFNPTTNKYPPWEIHDNFQEMFQCFKAKPSWKLCNNYPVSMPNVPVYGFPITGIYEDSRNPGVTIKVFPQYKDLNTPQALPEWKKYYYFRWNEQMIELLSFTHWSSYFEDITTNPPLIWTTNQWRTYPKTKFKVYQKGIGSQESFLQGAWIRRVAPGSNNGDTVWNFQSNCPQMNVEDNWNNPLTGDDLQFVMINDPNTPGCNTKFEITNHAQCTFVFTIKCSDNGCCKRGGGVEGIDLDQYIGIYQCHGIGQNVGGDDFRVFLPDSGATHIIFHCTKNMNAKFYATYTLKDTLHRRGSSRRRMMEDIKMDTAADTETFVTAEYKFDEDIAFRNIWFYQNISSESEWRFRRRLATKNPAWEAQIIEDGGTDCQNHNGDIYFLPGIGEDPCKELCFFSIDNDKYSGDECSHIFYSKTSYFLGCFVILQGTANIKWKHGLDNWMKLENSEWIKPFDVYVLDKELIKGDNEIKPRKGWNDNLNNQKQELQRRCDDAYDDGECKFSVDKPLICNDNDNQIAIVEISYHCKLGDGSVTLTRNIRDRILQASDSIDITINCRSQFSIKVDEDNNDKLLVTNLLDPVPSKDDIFILEHQKENKYYIRRLKKKNGITKQCIVYDSNNDAIKLQNCDDMNINNQFKYWSYWNDGRLSLEINIGVISYKWLTHNEQQLMVTSVFDDAVGWSFDGSFSGCADDECVNGNIYDNTITFDTTASKGFSVPNFDPKHRKNSIYLNGWLMVSDTVFRNQDTSTQDEFEYYDSLAIVVSNMYFGRNIYKNNIDIYDKQLNNDYKIAMEIDYISGGNMVLINGGHMKTTTNSFKQNAIYHAINSLKPPSSNNDLLSEYIGFNDSIIDTAIYNDIKLDVSELDERHFGIYYKLFHEISFNDKTDILSTNKFLKNYEESQFLEKSDHSAHHQLLFKYPSYSYDTNDRLQILHEDNNEHVGKLSNPYHCHKPYIPGIECVHECQYGYTSICHASLAPSIKIHEYEFNSPYKIIQKKTFENLKWSQDPDETKYIHPQCCSIATPATCTPYSTESLPTFYSDSNPSLIEELIATGKGIPVTVSRNSQTFPFDARSEPYQIKCKNENLNLITRGLSTRFVQSQLSYSRFCQFQDISPYQGSISGPDPDCRGPTVFSVSNSPLQKPLIWEDVKSFLLNDFQCEYQNNIDFSNMPTNTIHIYSRISTENAEIYRLKCDIYDSLNPTTIKFPKGQLLFNDAQFRVDSDAGFPEWNDQINLPILYAFQLPLGLYLDHNQELKGFPLSAFQRIYKSKFCVSNIAHYPELSNTNEIVLFDKRNCVELDIEVKDSPPMLLYYPLNAHEFVKLDKTHFMDSNINRPISQRHVLQTGQSFEINPIIEPRFLSPDSVQSTSINNKKCSHSDQEIIASLYYDASPNAQCDTDIDCIGDLNHGFEQIEYGDPQNIAIYNNNEYFELLNIDSGMSDALDIAKQRCQSICSLDRKCKSIVLTKNDHRRIPNKQLLQSTYNNDDVYICDVFYSALNTDTNFKKLKFDRFEQLNSFYYEKEYNPAPPLYLKYNKIKCKDASLNEDDIIRGLSVGFCKNPLKNLTDSTIANECECHCISNGYAPINLKPLHYNLFTNSNVFDARIKDPNNQNIHLCEKTGDSDCVYIPKTCLCQAKINHINNVDITKEDPPIIDAMIGTSSQCVNKGYYKQGLNINYGLIPYLIQLPPVFLCIKAWDIPDSNYTLANLNVNTVGLSVSDIKKFLDLFQSTPTNPHPEIPTNKFIKVAGIESRGYGVLPKFYKNPQFNVDLKDIGWNCYHETAQDDEYVTILNFKEIKNGNIRKYTALPLGFELDPHTGRIWSNSIPEYIHSMNIELQRHGHATYHKCKILYCNTAGCIVNDVRFEIIPTSMPKNNPRHLSFLDSNNERELLSGQIRWETVSTTHTTQSNTLMDGYYDTHHYNLWIDDGLNLNKSVKLYQSVIQWNQLFTQSKEQVSISNIYYRRGYRFLVIVSCTTLWCYNSDYNEVSMKFDDNEYYTENTNILEFFDYGDKPYYPVKNITSIPFDDIDGSKNEIAGTLTFVPPELYEHQQYRLYAGKCDSCRNHLVASVKWINAYQPSPTEMNIPFDSKIYDSTYLILVTANEHGENDQNVAIPLSDTFYNCIDWNPCDKSCMITDWKGNDNSVVIDNLAEYLPLSSCANHSFVQRECHRFPCPLSKVTIWPRHNNFDPDINYQIQTSRGYVSYSYRDRSKFIKQEPIYIYQKYSVKESRSKLKVTIFKDNENSNCHDSLPMKKCREYVITNQCIKSPMVILPQCQFSCGACNSKWDRVLIPSSNTDVLLYDISITSAPINTNIYVREIFIQSDITKFIDPDYLVIVTDIDQNRNVISIKIISMINKDGWKTTLYLIYIIDTIQPIYKEIEYDQSVVNHTLYQRYEQETTQYNSIIPLNTDEEIALFSGTTNNNTYGLIKVEVISYFLDSFTKCKVVNDSDSWRYNVDECGSISNIIYISIFKEMSLSHIDKQCLFYYVEYDNYDKWLTESFNPKFNANGLNEKYYSVFDENPGNKLGEIQLHLGCHSNLTWYIQIGIENDWIEWKTGGYHALENSDRFLTNRVDDETGIPFIEELRRYSIRMADIDKLVAVDERISIITNISIKIVDDNYSDTYILTCIRLPDTVTIKPILIKPGAGDIVPTGFLLTFIIKEDAYRDTLKLIIRPRESEKYETDHSESRIITLRYDSWISEPNKKHSVKFCPNLEECINTEIKTIVSSIKPSDNLIEFSLYDFILSYKDRWNNPVAVHEINEVMIVRDWTEDLHVLHVIYNKLNGKHWFIKWDIDNDDRYCDNNWYGIKCNSLKQIISINLFSNNLYGELPLEIGKLSSLQYLDLSSNYITGTIPITIQLLNICKYISFSSNSLIGSIPNGFENMNELSHLNLAGNMLSGSIPDGLILAAKNGNLKTIYLNANRLNGFISEKFKDIENMKLLYLSDNDWFCMKNDANLMIDYSLWAKETDYNSMIKCYQAPKEVLKLETPIDVI